MTLAAGIISYPLDTLRRRLMLSAGKTKDAAYRNARDAISKIKNKEGFGALFKGISATFYRSISGALLLVLYDKLVSWYGEGSAELFEKSQKKLSSAGV